MHDLFLEARAQLAYARMAAGWLDDQVSEHLGHYDAATLASARAGSAPATLASQAEFFRSALQPALSVAIVLSSFSLLEQALQRICERHAAYDKRGGKAWAQLAGSGLLRAAEYLRRVCSPAVAGSPLLSGLDDLRVVRNHLAHRGADFRAAPRGAMQAAEKHGVLLADRRADTQGILEWMFDLQGTLLDALEEDLAEGRDRALGFEVGPQREDAPAGPD